MSRAARTICVVLACILIAATGDSPDPPKSSAVARSERQYAAAIDKAWQECDRAVLAADKKRIADLDVSLKAAVNAKDLKEAERIDALKSAAQSMMQQHVSGGNGDALKLAGEWRVTYADGATRTYVIDSKGTVSLSADGHTGRLRNGVMDLGDGKLERWTPMRDMIVVEHFDPARNFPQHRGKAGIGVRSK